MRRPELLIPAGNLEKLNETRGLQMRMTARRATPRRKSPWGTKPRVGSLGEERNAAGAAFGGNPEGRVSFGRIAALLVVCLE